jgi:hypothetical protein
VAADPLVEADAAVALVAAPGRMPVEQADRDQEADDEQHGAAEGLDVEDYE